MASARAAPPPLARGWPDAREDGRLLGREEQLVRSRGPSENVWCPVDSGRSRQPAPQRAAAARCGLGAASPGTVRHPGEGTRAPTLSPSPKAGKMCSGSDESRREVWMATERPAITKVAAGLSIPP